MLTRVVLLSWLIIVWALVWFGMLVRWIARNPEWAEQLRRNECPRPWFFKVWTFLFISACICAGFLICYYILKFFLMIAG